MMNGLMCIIERSDDKQEIGQSIGLVDTKTDTPRFLSNMGGIQDWKKVSETDDMLAMSLVASLTGSTDTITLNKITGRFEREEKANPLPGEYISAFSSGQCR